MAVAHKGSISKGLVLIPVGMYKATVDNDIHFSRKNPFSLLPVGNENAVWVKPDHVCVVEYMPNLANSLRQPVFKGYRDDVLPKDIRMN